MRGIIRGRAREVNARRRGQGGRKRRKETPLAYPGVSHVPPNNKPGPSDTGKSACVAGILRLQRFVAPHEAPRRTWKSPDCRRCGKWEEMCQVRRRSVLPEPE